MDESPSNREESKWPPRLSVVFILLFALFWSLGSFFFWILGGLAVYFVSLTAFSSQSTKDLVTGFFSSFGGQRPADPVQQRSISPEVSGVPHRVTKLIRVFAFVFASLFVFLFLIGIFVGKENTTNPSETIEGREIMGDNRTSFWNDRGNLSLQDSRYDSALYYYDRALAIDPEDTYALYNKGLAYTLQQDYRRANGYAKKCVSFHPDYYPAWWLLGYNYDLLNNTDSALYFMENAYRNDYSQPDFLQLMAEVYLKKDRRKDALEAYMKLVTLDTTKADIFRRMAELDPAHADAYRRKAAALER